MRISDWSSDVCSSDLSGPEALEDDAAIAETAKRLACDFSVGNQTACASARMAYVMCGTKEEGIEKLKRLGQKAYEAMFDLPDMLTTRPRRYDPDLKTSVDSLRFTEAFYTVIGGEDGEGAVIVSHTSARVD